MPINIPKNLPAGEHLREEKIFVMEEDRARTQQIRPLNRCSYSPTRTRCKTR